MRFELRGLFDDEVVFIGSPIDSSAVTTLSTQEALLVGGAVNSRRREFATARMLAREALALFGLHGFEILHDAKRAPIWPEGFSGSLSHCGSAAFAAIGRRSNVGTLGIDAEDGAELAQSLWATVLAPDELEWLASFPLVEQARIALITFSAKEALYKAQYPRSGCYLDFCDVQVRRFDRIGNCDGSMDLLFRRNVGSIASGTVVLCRFRELFPRGLFITTTAIRDLPKMDSQVNHRSLVV